MLKKRIEWQCILLAIVSVAMFFGVPNRWLARRLTSQLEKETRGGYPILNPCYYPDTDDCMDTIGWSYCQETECYQQGGPWTCPVAWETVPNTNSYQVVEINRGEGEGRTAKKKLDPIKCLIDRLCQLYGCSLRDGNMYCISTGLEFEYHDERQPEAPDWQNGIFCSW